MDIPILKNTTRQTLGQALVAEGALSAGQLASIVQAKARHPQFTTGQLASILYNVPVEVIDAVNLRAVVLPIYPAELIRRLALLAERDKFSRGLDVAAFVTEVEAHPVRFETRIVKSHIYDATQPGGTCCTFRHFIVTEAILDTAVTSCAGTIAGQVRINYHSETEILAIVDDDDQLARTLYYDLKALYLRSSRTPGSS